MHACVSRQLRVKCCSHDLSLADGHRIVAFGGDDFHSRADAIDFGRADKDHLGGLAAEFAFADRAVNLATVSIAANADIEHAQSGLSRVINFIGQQDRASAGAEGGLYMDELFQLFESGFAEQLEKCAGFAAGNHQAVNLVELFRLSDEHNFRAQLFEPFAVRVEIALQG